MCDSYLKLRKRDDAMLALVTDIMHEMWFLFNHTNYDFLQRQMCDEAREERDQDRYDDMGYDSDDYYYEWIDFDEIRDSAKHIAVEQYVNRVGRDNLPDFFPPSMRRWIF